MAIYHLHCDIIGRSGGRSATAAAAYRATCEIEDRTTGEKFDYTRKERAVFSEIITNGNAPEWATDRAELWNSCEEKENRKNSQFCRSFDIALMKEFDLETNLKLIEKWANENYVSRGLVADIAIHAPHKNTDGTTNENTHAHILIPTRKMDSQGWTEKDREANDHNFLKQVRHSWAEIVNAEFKARGMSERIDERTLEEQGIDREPQQHQGVTATAMERKGKNPDRKKYKNKENQEQEIISVSAEEVETALKADEEYKKLIEQKEKLLQEIEKQKKAQELTPDQKEYMKWLSRVLEMKPTEWAEFMKGDGQPHLQDWCYGEYQKTWQSSQIQAQVEWVKNNFNDVSKYFLEQNNKHVNAYNNFVKTHQKPWNDARMEKRFLRGEDWFTSDGEHFGDDPIQARIHQQKLRAEYDKQFKPLEMEADNAMREFQDCKNKNYEQVRLNISRHHKTLAERMREGALKLIKESPLFAPVRAMIHVVKQLRPQKDEALKQFQEQERIRKAQERALKPGKDKGYEGIGY